ncbi:SLC13 family permease [Microbacterium sp. NPDC089189]|uniref:SLC13 family permease n=1 Tax=Microbacterium sp. NPDC089189 TaxID=3154972 RepID=UPI00342E6C25
MDPIVATFVVLALAVLGFLSGRIPLEVVAIGVALALWATGVLSLPAALAGFGDPTVLFIASLFVVASALERSGITRWLGGLVLERAGHRRVPVLVAVGLIAAVMTAFLSINGAVAALVPVVAVIAGRARLPASQTMIPLAFIASAASLLTLTGTPVNVVISELAEAETGRGFGFAEFALVGLPLLVVTVAVVAVLGGRLLPGRPDLAAPQEYSRRETDTLSLVPESVRTGAIRTVATGTRRGARRTLVITAIMILLLATGLLPPAVAGLLAAGALVLTRVVTLPDLYRDISWTTLVLIAGMIPLSAAFLQTGAAEVVADGVLSVVGSADPHLALLAVCTVTVLLGQFISNVATVLIVAPVATALAANLDVSPLPFLMGLAVAGAAAFLTPVATPANLMVMAPGGYRFGDYWRLGLPLAILFLAAAVLYVPLIWPF